MTDANEESLSSSLDDHLDVLKNKKSKLPLKLKALKFLLSKKDVTLSLSNRELLKTVLYEKRVEGIISELTPPNNKAVLKVLKRKHASSEGSALRAAKELQFAKGDLPFRGRLKSFTPNFIAKVFYRTKFDAYNKAKNKSQKLGEILTKDLVKLWKYSYDFDNKRSEFESFDGVTKEEKIDNINDALKKMAWNGRMGEKSPFRLLLNTSDVKNVLSALDEMYFDKISTKKEIEMDDRRLVQSLNLLFKEVSKPYFKRRLEASPEKYFDEFCECIIDSFEKSHGLGGGVLNSKGIESIQQIKDAFKTRFEVLKNIEVKEVLKNIEVKEVLKNIEVKDIEENFDTNYSHSRVTRALRHMYNKSGEELSEDLVFDYLITSAFGLDSFDPEDPDDFVSQEREDLISSVNEIAIYAIAEDRVDVLKKLFDYAYEKQLGDIMSGIEIPNPEYVSERLGVSISDLCVILDNNCTKFISTKLDEKLQRDAENEQHRESEEVVSFASTENDRRLNKQGPSSLLVF